MNVEEEEEKEESVKIAGFRKLRIINHFDYQH